MSSHETAVLVAPPELDPALIALVKCHITTFMKWDALRAMSEQVGYWVEPTQLAREIRRPVEPIAEALDALAREKIVEVAARFGEPIYRLSEGQPTTVVVTRLMEKSTRSQELRQIIVAHILRAAV